MFIRVPNIDTSEIHSPSNELKNCTKEKYFHLVCDVIYDDKDLSSVLLSKGYALAYDRGTKTRWTNKLIPKN